MKKQTTPRELGPLTDADLDRVRKQQARAIAGGGAYQSWSRILDALEIARVGQEAVAAMQDDAVEMRRDRVAEAMRRRVVSHA